MDFYKMFPKINSLLVFITLFQFKNAVEVTIEQGALTGKAFTSRNGREYYGFLGIPFAKPPVGDLRFEPPQPPEPWNGARNATLLPPLCIQKDVFSFLDSEVVWGQEDCLYLNVFKPAKPKLVPLPVMVWIHGGGFIMGGSGMYDPKYFMDHDVVMVVIQYRVNILGFLSTGDNVLPGNMGMKDQVMALKWVQKNIAAFGGNPNLITLTGQSAGAASTHYHMYSRLSKDLFHRAIIQSGSALAAWSYTPLKLARQRAFALGTLTHCPTGNSKELINCLKTVPANELVSAHDKFYVWDKDPMALFSIVKEPNTVTEAFMTKNPWYEDEINKVPRISGFTSSEGLFKVARYLHKTEEKMRYLGANYKRILPVSLFYGYQVDSKEKIDQITEAIMKFYVPEGTISAERSMELVDMYTDGIITYSMMESLTRRTNTTYFYLYDHRNERTVVELMGQTQRKLEGACHGDEVISLFHLNGLFPEVSKPEDINVSERMIKYWVNFITTGKPDSNSTWTAVNSNAIEYLHITTGKDEMKTGLLAKRFQFWKDLNVIPPCELRTYYTTIELRVIMYKQVVLIISVLCVADANIVRTSKGQVSGVLFTSRNGSKYHAYLGIPFAKPPLGRLRFRDPEESDAWTGILIADEYAPGCPQPGWKSKDAFSEDCLYLNVFTPAVNDSLDLAVLVWIYGGGFVIGDASIYGPDYIMDKNVVFVTFNYRLGALGFLSADDKDLQGNYGMKDQVAALKWIKNNIKAFGGNPEKITIAGSSAGGASVQWHMISPLSKGLFRHAISQSGTATAVWSEIPPHIARKRALTFASLAGCYYSSTSEMVECLRDIPIQDVINIQRKFSIWNHNPLIFGIVVNNYSHDSFAVQSPWNTNSSSKIPWMVGFTSDEGAAQLINGLLSDNGTWIDDLNANKRRLLPMLLMLQYYDNVTKYEDEEIITDKLVKWYFNDKPISKDTVNNLKNLVADSYVIYAATESFFKHNATKYFYVYDHVNHNSFAEFEPNILNKKDLRAVHCDDLISLFRTSYFPKNLTGDDEQMSEFMVDLWINFVIHGNPNGASNTSNNTLWLPVSDNNLKYLSIEKNASMKTWYWKERYVFWKSLNLQRSSNAHRNTSGMMYFTSGMTNKFFLGVIAVTITYFSTRR
ncbi:uncharacterized protein LOC135845169 [Planococcus citri]|uniref:uncharacterized protein LOC135845169 n=1 Tax=Planococcus citri TaxID=170843 RepID=UPI0031F77706